MEDERTDEFLDSAHVEGCQRIRHSVTELTYLSLITFNLSIQFNVNYCYTSIFGNFIEKRCNQSFLLHQFDLICIENDCLFNFF